MHDPITAGVLENVYDDDDDGGRAGHAFLVERVNIKTGRGNNAYIKRNMNSRQAQIAL